ncbi:MAG: carbon-nitrogen hydrolase family protein, partial [Saccharofermentanales bacterium]
MKDKAKITMVQFRNGEDESHILERMEKYFQEAKKNGSDLIVFPEYVLGDRISIEHPRVKGFLELVRKYGMYAVAGLVEKHGSRWATTALMIDRQGNILGRYLKTHPASGDAPYFWPPKPGSDSEAKGILGNQFKVFHLDFGTVGIIQCYDGYFPEAWGCTSYLGAEVVLWINGRDGMVEDYFCLSAAHAYGCIVGANISNGRNTGFAGNAIEPVDGCEKEEGRLYPRIKEAGDGCVHATIL